MRFLILVADGQMTVPNSLKIPPLEQRKKRGYCKYHNFLGHKTSSYVLFRDLVQRGLNEDRLRFGDKARPHMQVDDDPLKDAIYAEVASYNVVEIIADAIEKLYVEAKDEVAECQMVEVSGNSEDVGKITPKFQFDEKAKTTYPTTEEKLIDFLNCCRLKNFEVMLCPRCSSVFDKEATKSLENVVPESKKRGKWSADHILKFSFTKSYIQFINNSLTTNYANKNGRDRAYVPYAKALAYN